MGGNGQLCYEIMNKTLSVEFEYSIGDDGRISDRRFDPK
jgi:hypothetical protein